MKQEACTQQVYIFSVRIFCDLLICHAAFQVLWYEFALVVVDKVVSLFIKGVQLCFVLCFFICLVLGPAGIDLTMQMALTLLCKSHLY